VWQPGLHKGFGVHAEPGAPVVVRAAHPRHDASVTFYRDVFGWDTHAASDTPEFGTRHSARTTNALAGIM
jgi:predicted enzyme related to lactoylglutathione lyase